LKFVRKQVTIINRVKECKETIVADQPDALGPGEHAGPDNIQAEAGIGPIPDGEMPGVDPYQDQRRRTLEMQPVDAAESNTSESGREGTLRRTGTDHDAIQPVPHQDHPTERRLDDSAGDNDREIVFDPTQDDSGPHSDQI
jgi:hypothetical protein